ncbi:MAG TPA: response regulator [Anaerolineae bacterium]
MPERTATLERPEFERLVRDALGHSYDLVALETHPLAAWLPRVPDEGRSRGTQLRDLLLGAIERLRPVETEGRRGSPAWRPYLLLRGRCVDVVSLQDLQTQLALSERQLRREQGRALQAVAAYLWDQFFPDRPVPDEPAAEIGAPETFKASPEPLDVVELMRGVAATLQRRCESEGAQICLQALPGVPRVLADRVILRQVLLSLLSYALDVVDDGVVTLAAQAQGDCLDLRVRFLLENVEILGHADGGRCLTNAAKWASALEAQFEQSVDADACTCQLSLRLPVAGQPLLLVVDDQETALRLFRRYLSQTGVRLLGLHDGREALDTARRLQPQTIMLDIMMPNTDGWEVLQMLQADPATHHIPVVICSVWEEPELASSLGAAAFLKKPITQKDLLGALANLHLLQTSAG